MPALIRSLAVSGSHKSDGTSNASGRVYLYEPGTTTLVAGYTSDALNEAWITVDGYIPLDQGGRVAIWINDQVDIVIADSTGTIINTHLGFNKTRAEQVEIENEGYTGAITDPSGAVSQGLGGKTDLDTVLTRAAESLGPDFMYLESAGGVGRTIHDKFEEIHISVKDLGAIGDGFVDDTAAIQNAINRVIALGGGIVYFPPGTYLVGHALAVTNATGVRLVGAGNWASIIANSSGVENTFTFNAVTGGGIDNLRIDPTSANTGAGIAAILCTDFLISNLSMKGGHDYGLDVSGNGNVAVSNSVVVGSLRGIRSVGGSIVVGGSRISSATTVVEFAQLALDSVIYNCNFAGAAPTGILFTAGLSGKKFTIYGCPSLGTLTLPIDLTGFAIDPELRQWGNGVDGYSVVVATGATVNPNRARGQEIQIRATSGGAGVVTINVALPVPSSAAFVRNQRLTYRLTAAAGGNITWTFDSSYVLVGGGSTIVGANFNTDIVEFLWDINTSEWRECFRSATLT